MTRIKLCGLSRPDDIDIANQLAPDYIGFVFAKNSRRYVSPAQAETLKQRLSPTIQAVGVFVNESPDRVATLLHSGVIDIAQLHGNEDEGYIARLRGLTDKPIIQAFRIATAQDIPAAEHSAADHLLLDAGAGAGRVFDWDLIRHIQRPYFLAGGLAPDNVGNAIQTLHPYGVDVSSGIETDGQKDTAKMAAFVAAVRKEDAP